MYVEPEDGATSGIDNAEEAPKTMEDTIRETLRGLQSPEDDHSASDGADVPATPEEKADRIRDAKGQFSKPVPEAPPVVGANQIAAPEAANAPAPAAAPEQAAQVSAAPNTWKKEAAATWAALPPAAQAEIQRREADFHKGIEQYREAATRQQNMDRVIAPYMETIKSLGVTPEYAIQEMMAVDKKLRFGTMEQRSAHLADLAQNYGIDLGQSHQYQQNIDPQAYALRQENERLQGYINQQNQMAQQQQEQALNSEIATFAADPKHSHFDAVSGHMAALLQAGQAKDLSDAYEQAVYANPVTRAAMLQQQAAAQREEAAKKAQAAKSAASVNVRTRASMPVSQPIGTMEDTIRAKFRELTGS